MHTRGWNLWGPDFLAERSACISVALTGHTSSTLITACHVGTRPVRGLQWCARTVRLDLTPRSLERFSTGMPVASWGQTFDAKTVLHVENYFACLHSLPAKLNASSSLLVVTTPKALPFYKWEGRSSAPHTFEISQNDTGSQLSLKSPEMNLSSLGPGPGS